MSALDLGECALLAGLIRAPVRASPFNHPDEARARRNQVLALMVAAGSLERSEAEAWMARPIVLSKER